MTRSLQAKLLILAVFAIGTLTGVVLTNMYETRVQSSSVGLEPPDSERRPPIPRFEDFLEMGEEQRAQLGTILRQSGERNRELQAETRPMYQALREQARDEIRSILTDEQRGRYEEWLLQLEEIRSERGGRGGRGRDNNR